jgi:hypothetical protein
MPEYYDPGTVQPRKPGAIAGTNYVNELRDMMERRFPIPQTGNADPPLNVSAGKLPTPEYQHQVFTGVSQNQGGFSFVRAHPML